MDLLAINGVSSLEELLTQKNNVLIGGNGSGKSRVLECIFQENIDKLEQTDRRVVCFSSGQNERYSSQYKMYVKTKTRAKKGQNAGLNCFFYNKAWSKLLIFLAVMDVKDGAAREFLLARKYCVEDEWGNDNSAKLEVGFKVSSDYVRQIQAALKKEESGDMDTIRTKPFHRALEMFTQKASNSKYSDYEFDKRIVSHTVRLDYKTLRLIPIEEVFKSNETSGFASSSKDYTHKTEASPTATRRPSRKELWNTSFFTQAALGDKFIIKSNAKLYFKKPNSNERLEIDDLSDGEYQLLFLYALIDLFDTPNTTFLLDEVDAHVHHENITKLWETLKNVQGKVITTTHLIDSIVLQDELDTIKLIEQGKILDNNQKTKELFRRLAILSRSQEIEYEISVKISHLVLIDDEDDWIIFKKLVVRKGLDISRLESIKATKKTSSYTNISDFYGGAKFQWIEGFIQFIENKNSWNTKNNRPTLNKATRKIFMVCDRDNAVLTYKSNHVQIAGEQYKERLAPIIQSQIKAYLLGWQRREIKNYLLSYTALESLNELSKFNNNKHVITSHYLQQGNNGDNNQSVKDNDCKSIIDPLINTDGWLDLQKLQAYIDLIHPEEISEDIENMYNFIVGNS